MAPEPVARDATQLAERPRRDHSGLDTRLMRVSLLLAVFAVGTRWRAGSGARARPRFACSGFDARVIETHRERWSSARAPGITTVGSSIGFSTNGSISPIAEEQSIASERTLEALRVFRTGCPASS